MAQPNRPVDRLVIARTASNGANVGPEVIRIRFPAKISRSLPVGMDLSNNKICEGRLRLITPRRLFDKLAVPFAFPLGENHPLLSIREG